MNKNRVKLTICGTDCVISSDETESYVRSVGGEVEKSIQAVIEKNPRVSLTMAAILTALTYCDDAYRATASADNLRSQIKDYLEDSSRARLEADEAKREIEKMKREIQTLRSRLSEPSSAGEAHHAQDKPAAPPIHRSGSSQKVQTGSFARPQQAEPQKESETEGFMSFFEKKDV